MTAPSEASLSIDIEASAKSIRRFCVDTGRRHAGGEAVIGSSEVTPLPDVGCGFLFASLVGGIWVRLHFWDLGLRYAISWHFGVAECACR